MLIKCFKLTVRLLIKRIFFKESKLRSAKKLGLAHLDPTRKSHFKIKYTTGAKRCYIHNLKRLLKSLTAIV
jgi:hypothetical protein